MADFADLDLFCRKDLDNALGAQVVTSAYDDQAGGSGAADLEAIKSCIRYGSTEVVTWMLANNYESALPTTKAAVPEALKFAALDFGIAYTMRRRPDVVKAMNGESWTTYLKTAVEKMKNFAATLQRLPREEVSAPANVGATVATNGGEVDRPASRTSCTKRRMFDDMGDY